MMAAGGGSSFDSLGMPKIRPRGSKGEEKPAEEAPATAAEVAPVRVDAQKANRPPIDLGLGWTD